MTFNDFLNPEGTTTFVIACDAPIEGVGRFGPYCAYRVTTPDGTEHMFRPSARVKEQLDAEHATRGATVTLRGGRAVTRDGRAYTRYDVVGIRAGAGAAAANPPASVSARDAGEIRMLRCVALKAAAATRGITGEPPEVLATASAYLDWLTRA